MTQDWIPNALPPLHGKTVVVTGGNAGLGYFTSEQLAAAGAKVVIAARNPQKAKAAITAIKARFPEAAVTYQHLDLASLASVRHAAAQLSELEHIDSLVANAGVIGSPLRQNTADGFELQFGTNHLGHFALVAELMPALAAHGSRIVHVGSVSHRWVRPDFTTAAHPRKYSSYHSYALSKLAVMSFGFELAHRLELLGSPAISVVAHPGYSRSMFTPHRPGVATYRPAPGMQRRFSRPFAQGKDAGAWPLVRAAVDDEVRNGDYWGPDGPFQLRGQPVLVRPQSHALERNAASRLIDLSQELTGFRLDL
jgi:NAD(P)-dependent dehydrogenase (short-subunit alcohol dehydrogenase family)